MAKVVIKDLATELHGIDVANLIANNPALPYTATQDCLVSINVNKDLQTSVMYVDGIEIGRAGSNNANSGKYMISTTTFPLAKGQIINATNYTTIRVFAIEQ